MRERVSWTKYYQSIISAQFPLVLNWNKSRCLGYAPMLSYPLLLVAHLHNYPTRPDAKPRRVGRGRLCEPGYRAIGLVATVGVMGRPNWNHTGPSNKKGIKIPPKSIEQIYMMTLLTLVISALCTNAILIFSTVAICWTSRPGRVWPYFK